jgi:hypothetical protein
MPALVAGIHVFIFRRLQDVDGRNKSGHDEQLMDRHGSHVTMRYWSG